MDQKYSADTLLNERQLYLLAESRANYFNLKCLALLCVFALLCEICNNIGVFVVEKRLMHACSAGALGVFLVPILVWYIHDRIQDKSPSVTEWEGFRYLIVIATYVGIALYNMALTYHAVILLVLPPIFAAQYSDQKRLLRLSLICGILVVPIGVYFGYFYGLLDNNQVIDLTVKDGKVIYVDRVSGDLSRRMLQLFLYFVFPRILGVITINVLVSGIARRNGKMLARQATLAEQMRNEMTARNELQGRVIEDLSALIETRDVDTGQHVFRTKHYVSTLLHAMKEDPAYAERIDDTLIEEIETASPLHDVGKISISDTILLKPGKLSPEEFEVVKSHCTKGGEMVRNIFSNMEDSQFISIAEDVALHHHERWDGTGYPDGLKGEEISLAARVMAIADVYDALISKRVYKKAMDPADALQIIYSESGSHFDPGIIRILKEQNGAPLQ